MTARHSLQQLKPDGHALFQQQHAPWEARSEFAVPQMAQAMHILKCAPSPIRRRISELFQTCEHSNHQQAERMASAERQLEHIQSEYVRLHRDRKREVADLSDEIASLKDLVRLSVHLHGSTSSSGGSAAALRAAADNLDLRAEMARLRLELDASRVENIKLLAEIEAVRGGGATGNCPPPSSSSFAAASFDSAPPRFGDSAVYEQEEYGEEQEEEDDEDEDGLLTARHIIPRAGAGRFQAMDASDLGFFDTLPPAPTVPAMMAPPPPPPASAPLAPSEYPAPPPSYAQTLSNLRPAAPVLAPASSFELPPTTHSAAAKKSKPNKEGGGVKKAAPPPPPPPPQVEEGEEDEEEEGSKKKKAGMPRPQWVPLSYHKNPPKYPCVGPRRKKRKGASSAASKDSTTTTTTTTTTTNTVTEHHHHVHHHYIASTVSSPDYGGRLSPAAALSLSPSPCASPVGGGF